MDIFSYNYLQGPQGLSGAVGASGAAGTITTTISGLTWNSGTNTLTSISGITASGTLIGKVINALTNYQISGVSGVNLPAVGGQIPVGWAAVGGIITNAGSNVTSVTGGSSVTTPIGLSVSNGITTFISSVAGTNVTSTYPSSITTSGGVITSITSGSPAFYSFSGNQFSGTGNFITTGSGLFNLEQIGNATNYLNVTENNTYTSVPSYLNADGKGNRNNFITVTKSVSGWQVGSIGQQFLVFGYYPPVGASLSTGIEQINPVTGNPSGYWIQCDFGAGNSKLITEVTHYLATSGDQGFWKWQGSNDASNWTDASTTQDLVASTNVSTYCYKYVFTLTNTSGYRFYRLLGVSGDNTGYTYNNWFNLEFKIDDYGILCSEQTINSGSNLGILQLQGSGGVTKLAGLTVDAMGNVATTNVFNLGGLSVDGGTAFVDNVNHRFGVGQQLPTQVLDVAGTAQFANVAGTEGSIYIGNSTIDGVQHAELNFYDDGNNRLEIKTMYNGAGNYIVIVPGTSETLRLTNGSPNVALVTGVTNSTAGFQTNGTAGISTTINYMKTAITSGTLTFSGGILVAST